MKCKQENISFNKEYVVFASDDVDNSLYEVKFNPS